MKNTMSLAVAVVCLLPVLPAGAADKPATETVEPMKDLRSVMPAHGTASIAPATNWEYALVSGNGRMGAMVFSNPHDETIVANHARLYLPLGSRDILPDLAKYVPELRTIIREKGYKDAMTFFLGKAKEQGFPGLIWTDPFHPGFFLDIQAPRSGPVRDYVRTENFATGEVTVQWRDGGGLYKRRMFVSRPDNVIVLSIRNDGEGKTSCGLTMPPIVNKRIESKRSASESVLTCHNVYVHGKGGYDGIIRVAAPGGKVGCDGNSIFVAGADEVVVLMRIEPFTKLADSKPEKLREALAALPADYDKLLAPHAKAHGEIFNRVSIDLAAPAEDRALPGETLLDQAAKTGKPSPALLEKMYDAGRYMFICSAGELPPNLQGIWTGTWTPDWSGDFTLDTNVQAAVGSGLSCDMHEGMEGYYRLIESLVPDWRLNARMYYGARGVFACTRASNTGLHLHWGAWPGVFWTAGAGWLAHWFYDEYRYTGDKQFLAKRTIPLLKEIALFYEDFLVVGKDGKYEFIPSYSPETGCGMDPTMDIAVAREVLSCLIEGCRDLGIEADNIPKWQAMLDRMPGYRINDRGELAEWITGEAREHYGHRHHSHLYPVFQSFEFAPEKDPKLWEAAKKATLAKIASNGEQSSFGRMQAGLAAAYLRMPQAAYERLAIMAVKKSMYPSMITSHEPNGEILNTDGNGSIPELLNMMLFFSWPGRLDLLPALPYELPAGTIRGVRARGQIRIDNLTWNTPAGTIHLELTSAVEQIITLRMPSAGKIEQLRVTSGAAKDKPADAPNARELTLPAGAAVTIEIQFQGSLGPRAK